MSETTTRCYLVFGTGVILPVQDAEDALECAKDNGYTVDDYGRYWWYEEHEYDEDGEPVREAPATRIGEVLGEHDRG